MLASVGTEVGLSPWRVVSQTMIDQFADATDDHQFIHVDPERAARETPFGGNVSKVIAESSDKSRKPCAMVPPKGVSRAARSGSTWMNW